MGNLFEFLKQSKTYNSFVLTCAIADIQVSVWGKKFEPEIPPPIELNKAYVDLLRYARSDTPNLNKEVRQLFGVAINNLYADYKYAKEVCMAIAPNIDDYCNELTAEISAQYPQLRFQTNDKYGKKNFIDTSEFQFPQELKELIDNSFYYLELYYEGILPGEQTRERYYEYLDLYNRPIIKKGTDIKYKLIKTRFEDLHMQAYGKTFILKKLRSGARPYILMKYLFNNPSEIIYRDDIKEYKDTNISLLEIITSLRLPPHVKHLFFSASSDHAMLVPEITFEEFFDQNTDENKFRMYLKTLQVV